MQEQFELDNSKYTEKMAEREAYIEKTGENPKGRVPSPPFFAIKDQAQYNFTDPQSRIMNNCVNKGFNQHYNGQIAVDHQALLIISNTLTNHPNDQLDALPTIDGIALRIGKPKRAALDTGYFSVTNIEGLEARQIEQYIATGRHSHQAY